MSWWSQGWVKHVSSESQTIISALEDERLVVKASCRVDDTVKGHCSGRGQSIEKAKTTSTEAVIHPSEDVEHELEAILNCVDSSESREDQQNDNIENEISSETQDQCTIRDWVQSDIYTEGKEEETPPGTGEMNPARIFTQPHCAESAQKDFLPSSMNIPKLSIPSLQDDDLTCLIFMPVLQLVDVPEIQQPKFIYLDDLIKRFSLDEKKPCLNHSNDMAVLSQNMKKNCQYPEIFIMEESLINNSLPLFSWHSNLSIPENPSLLIDHCFGGFLRKHLRFHLKLDEERVLSKEPRVVVDEVDDEIMICLKKLEVSEFILPCISEWVELSTVKFEWPHLLKKSKESHLLKGIVESREFKFELDFGVAKYSPSYNFQDQKSHCFLDVWFLEVFIPLEKKEQNTREDHEIIPPINPLGQQIKQGKISDLKEDNATTWIPDSDQEREEELVSQDRELLLKNGGLQGKNVSSVGIIKVNKMAEKCQSGEHDDSMKDKSSNIRIKVSEKSRTLGAHNNVNEVHQYKETKGLVIDLFDEKKIESATYFPKIETRLNRKKKVKEAPRSCVDCLGFGDGRTLVKCSEKNCQNLLHKACIKNGTSCNDCISKKIERTKERAQMMKKFLKDRKQDSKQKDFGDKFKGEITKRRTTLDAKDMVLEFSLSPIKELSPRTDVEDTAQSTKKTSQAQKKIQPVSLYDTKADELHGKGLKRKKFSLPDSSQHSPLAKDLETTHQDNECSIKKTDASKVVIHDLETSESNVRRSKMRSREYDVSNSRRNVRWKPEEEATLLILEEGKGVFHPKRTSVDLKDKWRNLQRRKH